LSKNKGRFEEIISRCLKLPDIIALSETR